MSDINSESGASSSDHSAELVGAREDDWEWGDDEAPATTRYFQTLRANPVLLRKPNLLEGQRAGLAPRARSRPPRAPPRAAGPPARGDAQALPPAAAHALTDAGPCGRLCRDLLNHEIEHESPDACLDHCSSAYGWDLRALAVALQLDIYGSIRLVNYLRKEVMAQRAALDDAALIKHLKVPFVNGARPALLDDDALLFPVLEDDALLPVLSQESFDGPDDAGVSAAAGSVESLRLENEQLRNQLIAQNALLEDAKASLCATVEDAPDAHSCGSDSGDDAGPAAQSGGARGGKRRGRNPRNFEANEKHYFDSYAKTSIHHEMLSDHTRTESYRLFLQENPSLIKDKIVLDGTPSVRAPPPPPSARRSTC